MIIRPVEVADFPTLITMYQACFREPPWFEEFTTEEVRADFEQMSEWPDTIFLVIEENQRVIGAIIAYDLGRKTEVKQLVPDNQSTAYTAEIFVDPRERGRGLAKKLVLAQLALARIRGFTHLTVRTSIEQLIVQHLFCEILGAKIVAEQNVVSTKVVNGVAQQLPDRRILMYGRIPEVALTETLRSVWLATKDLQPLL